MVKYFSKTWFFGGYDLVCSTIIQPRGLIGSNIDTPINAMLMDDNKMAIKYTIKVQKPLRGTVTKFEHYTMIIGPTYYYNPEVKQKLQDLLVGYTNPT